MAAANYYPHTWRSSLRGHRKALALACFLTAVMLLTLPFVVAKPVVFLLGTLASLGFAQGAATFRNLTSWPSRDTGRVERLELAANEPIVFLPQNRVTTYVNVGAGLLLVVFAVASPWIVAALPSDGTRVGARLAFLALVAPAIGLLAIAGFTLFLLGKRKVLGVGLGSEGLYYWWWGGCCVFQWDSIRDVALLPKAGPRIDLIVTESSNRQVNPEENWLGRMDFVRDRRTRIQLAFLDVHPAIAYQAICFYIRHRELRDELRTDRALERFRQGDYPDVVDEVRQRGVVTIPTSGR